MPPAPQNLVERIDALLPQTQCKRCGFPACRPYAEAIANGEARINRCPPGGERVIGALGALLSTGILPLDPACGAEQPRRRARVVEAFCIGCTLCIQACPVDAIIGAPKRMHVVLADACTGCELCLAPCPVDCIEMVALDGERSSWTSEDAGNARTAYERRLARLQAERPIEPDAGPDSTAPARGTAGRDRRRAIIQAALDRVSARRRHGPGSGLELPGSSGAGPGSEDGSDGRPARAHGTT